MEFQLKQSPVHFVLDRYEGYIDVHLERIGFVCIEFDYTFFKPTCLAIAFTRVLNNICEGFIFRLCRYAPIFERLRWKNPHRR